MLMGMLVLLIVYGTYKVFFIYLFSPLSLVMLENHCRTTFQPVGLGEQTAIEFL